MLLADTIAYIETEDLRDIVLVGHSFGGMTISAVAEAAPTRIRTLVYVAAYLPKSGDSLLSPVLAGEQTIDEIILNDWQWYADNHITLHTGFTVTDVDRVRRIVHATSATGETITAEYDRLTGSNPRYWIDMDDATFKQIVSEMHQRVDEIDTFERPNLMAGYVTYVD